MQDWGSLVRSSFLQTTVRKGEAVVVNMRACGEKEVHCHLFLTSTLDGSE